MNRQPTTLLERLGEPVLEAMRAGASATDAAREAGCAARTVERWIARGTADPDGTYGYFAAEVAEIRATHDFERELTDDLSPAELERLVWKAARAGSVPAMRLAWQIIRARKGKPAESPIWAELDEVAARRQRREAAGV